MTGQQISSKIPGEGSERWSLESMSLYGHLAGSLDFNVWEAADFPSDAQRVKLVAEGSTALRISSQVVGIEKIYNADVGG